MRFRKRLWPLLACLAGPLMPVAHALPRHVDVVLRPGAIHEDCFPLRAHQKVQYNFEFDRPGKFALHFRRGKEVFYPIRSESVTAQKGDYIAAVAQDYCLTWGGAKDGDTKLGYEFIVVEPGLTKP